MHRLTCVFAVCKCHIDGFVTYRLIGHIRCSKFNQTSTLSRKTDKEGSTCTYSSIKTFVLHLQNRLFVEIFRNDPKFLDSQVWANSVP